MSKMYQYRFEVEPTSCHIISITVFKGSSIGMKTEQQKGFMEKATEYVASAAGEGPDSYVILKLVGPHDINGKKRTRTVYGSRNPVWNETFDFFVDAERVNILEISLMEEDYRAEQKIGFNTFNLNLLPLDRMTVTKLIFQELSEVELHFYRIFDGTSPSLRHSVDLCDDERLFLNRRKHTIYLALRRLLGEKNGPKSVNQVPTIAIIGSGGGFRAMISMCGIFKALQDSGIFDCATYAAGLSGSSWFLSTFYSHPNFPDVEKFSSDIRASVERSPLSLLKPQVLYSYLSEIIAKRNKGQIVSLTDLFGIMLRDTLLIKNVDAKLSQQREKLQGSEVPLPLYTCLNVKKNVLAKVFHDWIEFTPFEIGFSKYGAFMKTEQFGSRFFLGRLRKSFPEYPLHYLQGIWGSAFCVLLRQIWKSNKPFATSADIDDAENELEYQKQLSEFTIEEEPRDPETAPDSSKELSDTKEVTGDSEGMMWRMFRNALDAMYCSGALNCITGRAASIFNPLRGLGLKPLVAQEQIVYTSHEDDQTFKGEFEPLDTDTNSLYMVDGGLTFNSPYPLLLRPQRGVQLFISFDFSTRRSDDEPPFSDLLMAEEWAKVLRIPFPPVKKLVNEKYSKQPVQEFYVFRHPHEKKIPIIILFVIVNDKFRKFKAPGVPRKSPDEEKFADFSIYDDRENSFSITKFRYTNEKFDQLSKLMEFNTLLGISTIKEVIADLIKQSPLVG